jgi:hypothetical protein
MNSNEQPPIFSPEKEKQENVFEQDRKMRFSEALIGRPILDGEPGYDKIFIAGKVTQEGNDWIVDISSDTPTVALDQKIKDEYELKDSLTIKEMRSGQGNQGLSLVSGGSFLWLNQGNARELVLLRRDDMAPVDAGCLTGPAGRCGEAPSLTSLNETNEEMIIIKSLSDTGEKFKLLGFYGEERQRDEVIHQKLRQVKFLHDHYLAKGDTKTAQLLRLIRGEDDIETQSIMDSRKPVSENSSKVITRVNGKVVDIMNNATAFLDSATNTLEIRETINVQLPTGAEIATVLDGEVWERDIVRVASLDRLEGEKMVAALANYYSKIRQGGF